MSLFETLKGAGNVVKGHFGPRQKVDRLDDWNVLVPDDLTDFAALAQEATSSLHPLFDERFEQRFQKGDTEDRNYWTKDDYEQRLAGLGTKEGTGLAVALLTRFKFIQFYAKKLANHRTSSGNRAAFVAAPFGENWPAVSAFEGDIHKTLYNLLARKDLPFSARQVALMTDSLVGIAQGGRTLTNFNNLAMPIARILDRCSIAQERDADARNGFRSIYSYLHGTKYIYMHQAHGMLELVRALARHLREDPEKHRILKLLREEEAIEQKKLDLLHVVAGPRLRASLDAIQQNDLIVRSKNPLSKEQIDQLQLSKLTAPEKAELLFDLIRLDLFLAFHSSSAPKMRSDVVLDRAFVDPAYYRGQKLNFDSGYGDFASSVFKGIVARKVELNEAMLVELIMLQRLPFRGWYYDFHRSLGVVRLIEKFAPLHNTKRVRDELKTTAQLFASAKALFLSDEEDRFFRVAGLRMSELLGGLEDLLPGINELSGGDERVSSYPGLVPDIADVPELAAPSASKPFYDQLSEILDFYSDLSDLRKVTQTHIDFFEDLIARDVNMEAECAERIKRRDAAAETLKTFEEGHDMPFDSFRGSVGNWSNPILQEWLELRRKVMGVGPIYPSETYKSVLTGFRDRLGLLHSFDDTVKELWRDFFRHALQLEGKSRPSKAWLTKANEIIAPLGEKARIELVLSVLDVFTPIDGVGPGSSSIRPLKFGFDAVPRAMIYLSTRLPSDEVGPRIAKFAEKHCFRTVPGVGIRDKRLGNSCLWALINRQDDGGVVYLARLLSRIKYPSVKKLINDALNEAAEKAGVTRGELDDLSAPDCGLAGGAVQLPLGDRGDFARLKIGQNKSVALTFLKSDGKETRSVPSHLRELRSEIKEIRSTAKEIEADIQAQTSRFERMWLDDRTWCFADWLRRIALHPLLGTISSRLIWCIEQSGDETAVVHQAGNLTDLKGQRVTPPESATVRLWHPIDQTVQEVFAWRERLSQLQIVQPFKQAHREVYVVTDAERETGTYSNRFAGHIVKQHQMMTLARLNNWKVTHRIWADVPNDETTELKLPAFNAAAEFWTQGAGGEDPPVTDAQAFLYLSTDQVRFYTEKKLVSKGKNNKTQITYERGECLDVASVPALIFSEVMRQCDLFTSVASVARDPDWLDGGAEAEHPSDWRREVADQYWLQTALGDLTSMAQTRKELLEEIVPGLKIGDRLSLDGSFLTVRGNHRSYKLHVGSGNVLLMPENRYICIVPGISKSSRLDPVLPFEGDPMLSLILSKAFMLAEDDKISDQIILRQIHE